MKTIKNYVNGAETLAHQLRGPRYNVVQNAVSHGFAYAAYPMKLGFDKLFPARERPNSHLNESQMSDKKKKTQRNQRTKQQKKQPPARRPPPPKTQGRGGRGRKKQQSLPLSRRGRKGYYASPPVAVSYTGDMGMEVEWFRPNQPGCTGLKVQCNIGTLSYPGTATGITITTSTGIVTSGVIPLTPWNARYFPQQIAQLVNLFERWDMTASLKYQPTSSTSSVQRFVSAYISDPAAVYDIYGVSDDDSKANYNQLKQRQGAVGFTAYGNSGGPVHLGAIRAVSKVVDDMKYVAGDLGNGEEVHFNTTDPSDLRSQVKGAWLVAANNGATANIDCGEFFMTMTLILCNFAQAPVADPEAKARRASRKKLLGRMLDRFERDSDRKEDLPGPSPLTRTSQVPPLSARSIGDGLRPSSAQGLYHP